VSQQSFEAGHRLGDEGLVRVRHEEGADVVVNRLQNALKNQICFSCFIRNDQAYLVHIVITMAVVKHHQVFCFLKTFSIVYWHHWQLYMKL
jgi:hypothetical protein